MAKSLLEKVKDIKTGRRSFVLSPEELELIQAWLDDDVVMSQITKALNKTPSQIYVLLACGAKELYRKGKK